MILLFLIILLVFGPSRLEGLGSSLGRAIHGFKKGLEEGSSTTQSPAGTAKDDSTTTTVTVQKTDTKSDA